MCAYSQGRFRNIPKVDFEIEGSRRYGYSRYRRDKILGIEEELFETEFLTLIFLTRIFFYILKLKFFNTF